MQVLDWTTVLKKSHQFTIRVICMSNMEFLHDSYTLTVDPGELAAHHYSLL